MLQKCFLNLSTIRCHSSSRNLYLQKGQGCIFLHPKILFESAHPVTLWISLTLFRMIRAPLRHNRWRGKLQGWFGICSRWFYVWTEGFTKKPLSSSKAIQHDTIGFIPAIFTFTIPIVTGLRILHSPWPACGRNLGYRSITQAVDTIIRNGRERIIMHDNDLYDAVVFVFVVTSPLGAN